MSHTSASSSPVEHAGHQKSTEQPSEAADSTSGQRGAVRPVPILDLQLGDSPRLKGEARAHVMRLAETEEVLPPILVDKRTMRVIDGAHRLLAASLNGRETIEVVFFDGTVEDAFLTGVKANIKHGLPLSQADRRAAAARILISHPSMSDRAIAESTGLGARTVAELRRSTCAVPQLAARVGRDGKVRPLNSAKGRLRVAELIAENPQASLRHLASAAGVSPATALDVRRRLERGEEPVLLNGSAGPSLAGGQRQAGAPATIQGMPPGRIAVMEKLLRDPSLRHSDQGRQLQHNASGAKNMSTIVAAVPSHCIGLMIVAARQYSRMWMDFARELDKRAKIADPWVSIQARG